MFVYELSGCRFESRWRHLNFRYRACFEHGNPWYLDNYIVLIHSKTRTWHNKNIQKSVSAKRPNFYSSRYSWERGDHYEVAGLQSQKKTCFKNRLSIFALQTIINDSGITGDFPDVLDTDWEVLYVSSYIQIHTPGCTYCTVSVRQVWFLSQV